MVVSPRLTFFTFNKHLSQSSVKLFHSYSYPDRDRDPDRDHDISKPVLAMAAFISALVVPN